MARWVYVGCVKSKLDHACEAQHLYISQLFRNTYGLAKLLTARENIRILSAKHGLIKLTDIVAPYEETLKTKSKIERQLWAKNVLQSINAQSQEGDEHIFLCGRAYWEFLVPHLSNAKTPLKGMSFGKINRHIGEILKKQK